MVDAIELKPCPFCGSTKLEIMNTNSPKNLPWAFVSCKTCGAAGPDNAAPNTAESSAKFWNDRV